MSKVGKIVLDTNYPNPRVIIVDGKFPRTLELVKNCDTSRCLKLSQSDVIKLNYKGKKLDDRSVNFTKTTAIYNLKIREIGVLTEHAYYKVLRNYVSYQSSLGVKDTSYLDVRDEVHEQLIKMMNKGIYGV